SSGVFWPRLRARPSPRSFPTRRSSDLAHLLGQRMAGDRCYTALDRRDGRGGDQALQRTTGAAAARADGIQANMIVLASKSASRRTMLGAAGVEFEVRPAALDERALEARMDGAEPGEVALALAEA